MNRDGERPIGAHCHIRCFMAYLPRVDEVVETTFGGCLFKLAQPWSGQNHTGISINLSCVLVNINSCRCCHRISLAWSMRDITFGTLSSIFCPRHLGQTVSKPVGCADSANIQRRTYVSGHCLYREFILGLSQRFDTTARHSPVTVCSGYCLGNPVLVMTEANTRGSRYGGLYMGVDRRNA